jgi:LytS/YehU family sensor histidine kinase
MEQARLEAELKSLGREVDPHFLFNNLNALAHLIDQRSDAASWFVRTLSDSYRYVLDCRGRALVPLADELNALERHRTLADVRYAGSVRLAVRVPPADARRLLLPPVSLSELFQNALKHNLASPDRPLHIRVGLEGSTLIFENEMRPAPGRALSTGVGLGNLSERFRIATGGETKWGHEDGRFVVRLPLVESRADAGVQPAGGSESEARALRAAGPASTAPRG